MALVIVVPVFLVSSITVLRLLSESAGTQAQIYETQSLVAQLNELQSEEETNVRGYLLTGETDFLSTYDRDVLVFPTKIDELKLNLIALDLRDSSGLVSQVFVLNKQWRTTLVDPALAAKHAKPKAREARLAPPITGKERRILKSVDEALSARSSDERDQTSVHFVTATLLAVAATLLLGGGVLAFGFFGTRYEQQIDRERAIVEKFQQAFVSRWDALAGVQFGTAYVSATHEAEIGGDLFDVRKLSAERGYVLIADVSGKGIDAAVDTAFIKFTIRALAIDGGQPGAVLESFNRLVIGSLSNPDAFVVAFLGFFDAATSTLRYASAGHAPAFLRRGTAVSTLAVTGPILGLDPDDTFATSTVQLAPGDTVVLATDGLTEARNARGSMLGEAGAIGWIAGARNGDDPQALADELVTRLRAFVPSRRLNDDLALLVVRVLAPGQQASTTSPQPAARASTSDS